MVSKKAVQYGIIMVLAVFCFFTGCKSTPDAVEMKPENGQAELSVLKGEWQSIARFSSAPALDEIYAAEAKKLPYYTEAGFKAAIQNAYAVPVIKALFDGSNTVVFTVADADGNEKTIACEYAFKGSVPIPGYPDHSWLTFEAVKPVKGLAQAQYLILTPPHSHEGGMTHWHARFGARGIQALVHGDPVNWPTFVDASLSPEQLLEAFGKNIAAMTGMLPAEPLSLYNGKWINCALIFDDPRPAIQEAYTQLIKEFAGKNPKGGDFTKEDILALVYKSFGSANDFTHLEFITENEKNELIIWKNGKEIGRSSYKQDKAHEARPTQRAFTADTPAKAGKLAHFSSTIPHGMPQHMHLWYGSSVEDIAAVKGTPTCIPADTSEKDIAAFVLSSCRRFLAGIVK